MGALLLLGTGEYTNINLFSPLQTVFPIFSSLPQYFGIVLASFPIVYRFHLIFLSEWHLGISTVSLFVCSTINRYGLTKSNMSICWRKKKDISLFIKLSKFYTLCKIRTISFLRVVYNITTLNFGVFVVFVFIRMGFVITFLCCTSSSQFLVIS